MLLPFRHAESFGMVSIEAMACGTPVVALRRGSVPEVIVDGVTGIVCDEPAELPAAIAAARRLSPADCRKHVQSRFDAETMVAGYEALYRRALLGRPPTHLDEARVPGPRRGVPAGAAA
jgi:glycosyltransferase involved in cell wall biosynthesis